MIEQSSPEEEKKKKQSPKSSVTIPLQQAVESASGSSSPWEKRMLDNLVKELPEGEQEEARRRYMQDPSYALGLRLSQPWNTYTTGLGNYGRAVVGRPGEGLYDAIFGEDAPPYKLPEAQPLPEGEQAKDFLGLYENLMQEQLGRGAGGYKAQGYSPKLLQAIEAAKMQLPESPNRQQILDQYDKSRPELPTREDIDPRYGLQDRAMLNQMLGAIGSNKPNDWGTAVSGIQRERQDEDLEAAMRQELARGQFEVGRVNPLQQVIEQNFQDKLRQAATEYENERRVNEELRRVQAWNAEATTGSRRDLAAAQNVARREGAVSQRTKLATDANLVGNYGRVAQAQAGLDEMTGEQNKAKRAEAVMSQFNELLNIPQVSDALAGRQDVLQALRQNPDFLVAGPQAQKQMMTQTLLEAINGIPDRDLRNQLRTRITELGGS